MAKTLSRVQLVRRIILGIILVGLIVMTFLHQNMQNVPSIDALDPFGGLETMMKFIAGGEFIKKIEPGTVVLFGGFVVLSIVLSRFFCGWFCAFGALQGVFGALGKKIFRRRFTVPAKLDRILRWVKYPVLAAVIFFTWEAGALVIRPYDPLAAFGHLSAGMSSIWAEFAVGFVMLVAILLLSMLYERVFCKYICPLGAVNAILSRIPLFRIKRVASTCISCSNCDHACPMNIDVSKPESVNSAECISCMECVTSCPTKTNSLIATIGGKAFKLTTVIAIGFGIYLGAAAVGQALGMLRFAAPSLQQQAAGGTLTVENIKGSSTWAMVASSFGIELERLYLEAGVDSKKVPPETMIKDTGKTTGMEGFEADAVRVAVAKILGVPYGAESESMTPASSEVAPPTLTASHSSAAVTSPVAAKSPAAIPTQAANPKPVTAPVQAALVIPAGFALEGTMSIADIAFALGAGTTNSAVIAKLGLPADIAVDKPLRDMKDQYGYTMPSLKEKFK